MRTILLAGAVALVLSGCAAMREEDHAAHHASGTAAPGADRADMQMQQMQQMHQKVMAAKTPEERQALMAEHMKAMQGGMSMMCEMGAGSNDMMKRCMDMKDMTLQMMMDRESSKTLPAK